MIKKNLKIIPLLFFSCTIISANAQKGIVSAGGSATGSGGSVSFSVGQLDFIAVNSANGSVFQGVQQPVNSSVLPITLFSFSATRQQNKVLLNWQTASEINSSKFVIQRSKDGVTFFNLTEVAAAGTSFNQKKYSTEDIAPLKGWNYYRIQWVDRDASFVYSKVERVNFAGIDRVFVVYPNPTKNTIKLTATNLDNNLLGYKLYDTKGGLLLSNNITGSETNIRISKLAAGNYYLKVIDQNGELIKTFQIIKTN